MKTSPSPHRHAFTLTELLVAMSVLALMAAMVVTAVSGVTRTAREARTRNIIAAIDSVLMEQYEAYKYRPFSVEIPDLQMQVNASTEVGLEVLAGEAARVRLMMIRDMQRMEMPDRLSDIADAPTALYAAAHPLARVSGTDQVVGTRNDKSQRRTFQVSWYNPNATFASGGDAIPSKLASYRSRFPTGFNFTSQAALSNQGAECLYLIMATSFVGGSPAIDVIPQTSIGDTDGDGLLEILDGWGQPLGFIRWPVGYFDLEQSVDTTVPEDFDLFRSDYAYTVTGASSPAYATDVNASPPVQLRPWHIRPLVFSAGADGEFGITSDPYNGSGLAVPDFSYRTNWDWPLDAAHYGNELPGRTSPTNLLPFPDPYLRRFIETQAGALRRLPGQLIDAGSVDALADNISNYK
jgi:prepilin-type N-terminal cleavage/methylation domain-containing protein